MKRASDSQNEPKKSKVSFEKESITQLTQKCPIKPWGNYMFDKANGIKEIRTPGLGNLSSLSDESLYDFLTNYILFPTPSSSPDTIKSGIKTIIRLSSCSKALYKILQFDMFWKDITIRIYKGTWKFDQSWLNTFKKTYNPLFNHDQETINVENLYSDYLFSAWHLAHTPIDLLCGVSRLQNGEYDVMKDSLQRASALSQSEFENSFSKKGIPCIITDVVVDWKAYREWTVDSLREKYGKIVFRAESVDITLDDYVEYSRQAQHDESPLYLFDCLFGEKTDLANDYRVPCYFNEDLFGAMTETVGYRPDYRWIIIGPERSGSTFHIDPNSTSAWNAVITGAKKWILFPPGMIPPGVFVSKDGSEVTSPQTLSEWYLHYYKETIKEINTCSRKQKPLVGICRSGEMVYVPNGWFHCVMNLEESIAITQNFVDSSNLPSVLDFLRNKKDQVSGFKSNNESVYDMFIDSLKKVRPNVLESTAIKRHFESLIKDEKPKDSFWSTMYSSSDHQGFGFKFNK